MNKAILIINTNLAAAQTIKHNLTCAVLHVLDGFLMDLPSMRSDT